MCVCVYVCMCVCVYGCMCACVYVYGCMHVYMHVCVCVCVCCVCVRHSILCDQCGRQMDNVSVGEYVCLYDCICVVCACAVSKLTVRSRILLFFAVRFQITSFSSPVSVRVRVGQGQDHG